MGAGEVKSAREKKLLLSPVWERTDCDRWYNVDDTLPYICVERPCHSPYVELAHMTPLVHPHANVENVKSCHSALL